MKDDTQLACKTQRSCEDTGIESRDGYPMVVAAMMTTAVRLGLLGFPRKPRILSYFALRGNPDERRNEGRWSYRRPDTYIFMRSRGKSKTYHKLKLLTA